MTIKINNHSFSALVLATEPAIALQILHCLADVPAKAHVLGAPTARRLALSRNCGSFQSSNNFAPAASSDDLVADIEAAISSRRIDVVLPSDAESTMRLAEIESRLSVPTFPLSSPGTLHLLSDKWEFYKFCCKSSLPVPKTILIGAKHNIDATQIGDELGFPAIIKPVDQGDGNGVVIVSTSSEVETLVSRNLQYPYDKLIAQEFIPGYDIDCSLLARNGMTLCSAIQIRELGVTKFLEESNLLAACSVALTLSRFEGLAHFDARYDERNGKLLLIECNPRFWRSIYAASACGLNFVAAGLRSINSSQYDEPISLKSGAYLSPDRYLAAAFGFKKRGDIGQTELRRALHDFLRDPLPVVNDFLYDEVYPKFRKFMRQRAN